MSDRCKRGHDLTNPDNVYERPDGRGDCRKCGRMLRRRRNLLSYYGITHEEYQRLMHRQGKVCGICGTYDSGHSKHDPLVVDHDHDTGTTRGLLCHNCNLGLGHFKDEVRRLRSAIHYLETHDDD